MAVRLNDLQLAVLAALARGDRVVAIRAGWASGKTTALIFAALHWTQQHPGTVVVVVTDTYTRLRDVWEGPEGLPRWAGPLGWRHKPSEHKWIDDSTGSEIWLRAYHTEGAGNPLEGINASCGIIDEAQALPAEVAVKLWGRLRTTLAPQMVIAGLPVAGAWWLEYSEQMGGASLLATSYVNELNLGPAWFEGARAGSEDQYRAMVLNQPVANEGAVYNTWRTETWPAGNLAPADWHPRPELHARLALDLGVRKAAALALVYDPDLDADVVVHDWSRHEASLDQMVAAILSDAWPRTYAGAAPGPRTLYDVGVVDPAGLARSLLPMLAQGPAQGGLGVRLDTTTDPTRRDILAGVEQVRRRICDGRGRRRLLCTRQVWQEGLRRKGISFARAIESYRWPERRRANDEPLKNGVEDPLDALRYDVIRWRWEAVAPGRGLVDELRRAVPAPAWRDQVTGDR